MWDLLFKNIAAKGIQLADEEAQFLQSVFHHKKLRKNQYLLQQGDVSKFEIFVIKGMVRSYLVDDKGHEHIMKFSPQDWWTGDLYSFYIQQPTSYNIDCLEDTEVLQISKTDMELLLDKLPVMDRYFRILYRNSVIAYNRRVAAALCNTALERYQEFIKTYPEIEQRVSNRHIASYLGITPQSLSRLRKQAVQAKKLT